MHKHKYKNYKEGIIEPQQLYLQTYYLHNNDEMKNQWQHGKGQRIKVR